MESEIAGAVEGDRLPNEVLDEDFDKSQIKKEVVDLSPIGQPDKLAFLLRKVLTPKECKDLIQLSEETGYGPAYVNFGDQQALRPGYRDGARVLIDDVEFVRILFDRISGFLPKEFHGCYLLEINERLRFLRYNEPGERFAPHCDGSYGRSDGSARTQITLQMYLNGGFEGGETTFLKDVWENGVKVNTIRVPVVPEPGLILVFEHNILHEGSEMKAGTKYTIRTDVLYTT